MKKLSIVTLSMLIFSVLTSMHSDEDLLVHAEGGKFRPLNTSSHASIDYQNITFGDINNDQIDNWLNIDVLMLSNCKIIKITGDLDKLVNLTELYVCGNYTKDGSFEEHYGALASHIYKLRNLKTLVLSSTGLTRVPPRIENMKGLEYLDLSCNGLKEVPEGLGMLENLMVLDLSQNDITAIPNLHRGLKNLEHLDLSANHLVKVGGWVAGLTKLSYLNLSNNHIKSITRHFGKLTALREIDFSYNEIKVIGGWVGLLSNLTDIDLSNNEIDCVSPKITEILSLNRLCLRNNPNLPPKPKWLDKLTSLGTREDLGLWA